jgi:hypothetical protein
MEPHITTLYDVASHELTNFKELYKENPTEELEKLIEETQARVDRLLQEIRLLYYI